MKADWQPIETAPKDGQYIIGIASPCTVPVIVTWQGKWIDKDPDDFDGHDEPDEAWKNYWDCYDYKPTHWMPLPEPPTHRATAR
jgi:hypothetical protein